MVKQRFYFSPTSSTKCPCFGFFSTASSSLHLDQESVIDLALVAKYTDVILVKLGFTGVNLIETSGVLTHPSHCALIPLFAFSMIPKPAEKTEWITRVSGFVKSGQKATTIVTQPAKVSLEVSSNCPYENAILS